MNVVHHHLRYIYKTKCTENGNEYNINSIQYNADHDL